MKYDLLLGPTALLLGLYTLALLLFGSTGVLTWTPGVLVLTWTLGVLGVLVGVYCFLSHSKRFWS